MKIVYTVAGLWSESSTGVKVPWSEFFKTFAPEERKFHGTQVLGLFAPGSECSNFYGTKVPQERKFSLWIFCFQERKCRGTKSPDAGIAGGMLHSGWCTMVCYRYVRRDVEGFIHCG